MKNPAIICPRCEGAIPNNETPGAYPGALSRADNKTEICSACGTDEALRAFYTGGLVVPIKEWPVPAPHEFRAIAYAQQGA